MDKDLREVICDAIDVWSVSHPEMTVGEILEALDEVAGTYGTTSSDLDQRLVRGLH